MWSSDLGFILQHVLHHLQREVPVKCGWLEEWFGRGLKNYALILVGMDV